MSVNIVFLCIFVMTVNIVIVYFMYVYCALLCNLSVDKQLPITVLLFVLFLRYFSSICAVVIVIWKKKQFYFIAEPEISTW